MTTTAPPNPFDVLELPHDASHEDIKRAFRRLLLIYHPDKQGDTVEGDDRVIAITHAYRVLSDPVLREEYERGGNGRGGEGKETTATTAERRARNPARTINLEEFTFHAFPWPPSSSSHATTAATTAAAANNVTEEDVTEETGFYTHPCRCSASYRITLAQLEEGVDVVGCEGCGEWVGVGYVVVEEGSEEGSEEGEGDDGEP